VIFVNLLTDTTKGVSINVTPLLCLLRQWYCCVILFQSLSQNNTRNFAFRTAEKYAKPFLNVFEAKAVKVFLNFNVWQWNIYMSSNMYNSIQTYDQGCKDILRIIHQNHNIGILKTRSLVHIMYTNIGKSHKHNCKK